MDVVEFHFFFGLGVSRRQHFRLAALGQENHVVHDCGELRRRQQGERRHRRADNSLAHRAKQVFAARTLSVRSAGEFEDAGTVVARTRLEELRGGAGAIAIDAMTLSASLGVKLSAELQMIADFLVGAGPCRRQRRTERGA